MRQPREGAGVPGPQARRARALVGAALVGGRLVPGDAIVEDGRIVEAGLVPRGGSGIAAPGFVDLHVNGFAGVDFLGADASGYARAEEALLATGVVGYRPTFVSAPEDALADALRSVPPSALGAHVEGPFISRLGAHLPEHRRDPDPALLARLLDAGDVGQVTLAPELAGAADLIAMLRGRGIVVCAGHSDAPSLPPGVDAVTHVFNAMGDELAAAALDDPDVVVQVIADRIHVSDERLVDVFTRARGRVALVTDATAAACAPDGAYRLGPLDVIAHDGIVRGPNGRLAGTALTMDAAVRNVVALGVPVEEALRGASVVPARLARRDVRGVVVLDDRLEVVRTLR